MKFFLLYTRAEAEKNAFLISKYKEAAASFGAAFSLIITDEQDPIVIIGSEAAAFGIGNIAVISRTRDPSIARKLELMGVYVSNSSEVCRIANDKWQTFLELCDLVPMMPTVTADSFISAPSDFGFPAVIKPIDGHGGKGVELVHSSDELSEYLAGSSNRPLSDFIVQPLASGTGRDLRIYMIGKQPVAAMLRVSENDFRSNYSLGGSCVQKSPDELLKEELGIVYKVAERLSPDYIGIDLIYNIGRDGKEHPVLNEIEDPVGARMLYNNTDIDPAFLHIGYIMSCI